MGMANELPKLMANSLRFAPLPLGYWSLGYAAHPVTYRPRRDVCALFRCVWQTLSPPNVPHSFYTSAVRNWKPRVLEQLALARETCATPGAEQAGIAALSAELDENLCGAGRHRNTFRKPGYVSPYPDPPNDHALIYLRYKDSPKIEQSVSFAELMDFRVNFELT